MSPLGGLLEPIEAFAHQFALMLLLAHQAQLIAGVGVAKASRALPPLGSERRILGSPSPAWYQSPTCHAALARIC